MKFKKTLSSNIISHWEDRYIDYEYLKSFMKLENWKNSTILSNDDRPYLGQSSSSLYQLDASQSIYGSRTTLINKDEREDSSTLTEVFSPLQLSTDEIPTIIIDKLNQIQSNPDKSSDSDSTCVEMEIFGSDSNYCESENHHSIPPLDSDFIDSIIRPNVLPMVTPSPSLIKQSNKTESSPNNSIQPNNNNNNNNSLQTSSSSQTCSSASTYSSSNDIFITPPLLDGQNSHPHQKSKSSLFQEISLTMEDDESINFQSAITREIDKIQIFYESRLEKFKNKSIELFNLISFIKSNWEFATKSNLKFIKSGYKDNHYCLSLLSTFRETNKLGFDKILLKYTKFNPLVADRCKEYIEKKSFYSGDELALCISDIKIKYAKHFTGKDVKKAKKAMKSPTPGNNRKLVFSVGILLGLCLLFFALIVYSYNLYYPKNDPPANAPLAWLLFRISLLPIMLGTFFSLQSFIWELTGINYVFIFNLKPKYSRSSLKHFQIGLAFILLWLLCFFMYIESTTDHTMIKTKSFPSLVYPILFLFISILVVFNPLPILAHKTRFWVIKRISMVLRAPFVPVTFADFFMSVQLLTLAEFFFNIQSMVCIFNYSSLLPDEIDFCKESTFWALPLLNAIPFYFRIMQCFRRYYETKCFFPHITSAIRSIFSIIILVLNYFALRIKHDTTWNVIRGIWFAVNIIGSFYKWAADMTVDWGFFCDFHTNKAYPLRTNLHFKRKWIYYMAIVYDFILRYAWLFVFLVRNSTSHRLDAPIFLFFYSMGEVVWATQFIFFRVEFEHVQTPDKYSLFVDPPIPFKEEFNKYVLLKENSLKSKEKEIINNNNDQ
ncbi:SPX domain-containing protein [Heterostelium album PN500]|uniref:SPX domain-containing protein n=1 Tax=Heterostelium pallidum (strain ATCC 26659 / Pp 5 / PN500) TaxID=670386 RepID=D3BRB8_HETP5|nr:SPX domain-containing protein [Heterostelium album PN500]EFA75950.1 SPX domain-containing protein [Heterostelium album PN500]|eukprot:XP_020428084.1 SPX domain-containing protein [Heterostelium album PN500]